MLPEQTRCTHIKNVNSFQVCFVVGLISNNLACAADQNVLKHNGQSLTQNNQEFQKQIHELQEQCNTKLEQQNPHQSPATNSEQIAVNEPESHFLHIPENEQPEIVTTTMQKRRIIKRSTGKYTIKS